MRHGERYPPPRPTDGGFWAAGGGWARSSGLTGCRQWVRCRRAVHLNPRRRWQPPLPLAACEVAALSHGYRAECSEWQRGRTVRKLVAQNHGRTASGSGRDSCMKRCELGNIIQFGTHAAHRPRSPVPTTESCLGMDDGPGYAAARWYDLSRPPRNSSHSTLPTGPSVVAGMTSPAWRRAGTRLPIP